MIDTLKNQVLKVLTKYPKTRDSDVRLMLTLWLIYYPSRIHKQDDDPNNPPFVYLKDIMELPREDNIKRIRAVIQNVEGKFLPTSLQVAKQRKINEEVWRDYIKNGTI